MPQGLSAPWPFGLNRRRAILFAIVAIAAVVLVHQVDYVLSDWGRSLPSEVRQVFRWLTRWGESDWILIPAAAAWLIAWVVSKLTRERLQAAAREVTVLSAFIFAGVALPSLVAALFKRILGRGRPQTWSAEAPLSFEPLNWDAYAYQSFPSGHATTAFSLALTVAFLWPRLLWPMVLLAAAIAFSRVVVGAHYPADILAGAVLGTVGAYAVRNWFASRGWLFERDSSGGVSRRRLVAVTALFGHRGA